jgi:hypothetical protein
VKISYQVGLVFEDSDSAETRAGFEELVNLPDYTVEKHELFAHLLMMAMRIEWRMADRTRELERDHQQREKRRRERAKARKPRPTELDTSDKPR